MKGILFHFDCQPGAILSFFIFSFFSLYYCLPFWPRACAANRAAGASCGRFNIISLTEMTDLFCMWSMMKCDSLLPHTDAWRNSVPSLLVVCIGQKCSPLSPQGHCFSHGASWLSYFLSSLKSCLWTSFLFSSIAHFDFEKTIRLTQ